MIEAVQAVFMYLGFGVAAVAFFGVMIVSRRLAKIEREMNELWGE